MLTTCKLITPQVFVVCIALIILLCDANVSYSQELEETKAPKQQEISRTETKQLTYAIKRDVLYRDGDELTDYQRKLCRLDLYYPEVESDKNTHKFPTLIWFHGGGLKSGDKQLPEGLKEQGIIVVSANYRLYPKVKSPVYIDDAAAATAWVYENIIGFGGDVEQIYVGGHSAGGYLTMMLGLDKSYLSAYGVDSDKIAGLIPYSGHTITHFTIRDERGIDKEQPLIDEMAPLFHVRGDSPPLLLITGDREKELLGRYEENAYFWRMMQVKEHPDCRLIELKDHNHGSMVKPAHQSLLKFIHAKTSQLNGQATGLTTSP